MTKPSSRQPTPEPGKPQYTIRNDHNVEAMLRRQARTTKERLIKTIIVLADNPHHYNSRRLEGYVDLFRLRVSKWRIIYQIIDDQLLILVLEIGSRGRSRYASSRRVATHLSGPTHANPATSQ